MALDPQTLSDFRSRLQETVNGHRDEWQESRRLVVSTAFRETLSRLASAIDSSSLPLALREALVTALRQDPGRGVHELDGAVLKRLTGLPPTKAVRALCVMFGLGQQPAPPMSAWPASRIESYVRRHANPFDLLLETDVASVLELGAGDLSFSADLVAQYLPALERDAKELTLHCVDRLHPGSRVGGRYHADSQRLDYLTGHPSSHLRVRLWSGQDMFDLGTVRGILPCYTIVTCQAPPNPTVAYEPTRLSPAVIRDELRRTKGDFKVIREEGEEVLEVRHAGRVLLFPPWKFDISGPLALLDLVSRSGRLCVLSAVDTEVFWELLAQLMADPLARPQDEIFTPAVIGRVFGEVATALNALPVGHSLVLSDHAEMRKEIPRSLEKRDSPRPGDTKNTKRGDSPFSETPFLEKGGQSPRYRFRYVEVRRGALFPGVPASQTAKAYPTMTEEAPPWFLILVPEQIGVP